MVSHGLQAGYPGFSWIVNWSSLVCFHRLQTSYLGFSWILSLMPWFFIACNLVIMFFHGLQTGYFFYHGLQAGYLGFAWFESWLS